MSKEAEDGLSFKPFRFVGELFGARKVQIQEGTNLFKLGKKCRQCGKSLIHRDAISVCQCYCFAHKDCLMYQLKRANVSECTVVECRECQGRVNVRVDSDYYFKLNFSVGDLIVMLICAVLCAVSMVYLMNLKNSQREWVRQEEVRTNQRNVSLITIQEVIPLSVLFIFGTIFWFCLIGMVLNKKVKIMDIIGTNTEIKVSAFEQIEIKIREQSLLEIATRKEEIDL